MAKKTYKSPIINYYIQRGRKLAVGGSVVQGAGSIGGGVQNSNMDFSLAQGSGSTFGTDYQAQGGQTNATRNALNTKTNSNMIADIGAGVASVVSSAVDLSQNTGDLSQEYSGINSYMQAPKADTWDALEQEWSTYDPLDHVSWRDVRGKSAGQDALSVFGASHQGAMAGSSAGPWGCVCAGTRVITNNGRFVNIENLTQGDGIIGWDKGYVRNSIFAFQPPAEKECVEITFSNGEILRCSTDHPILYYGIGRAKRVYIEGQRHRVKDYKFVEAQSLKSGDIVGLISEVPIWGDKSMWNPYLVGLLIGDGSYGYDKSVGLASADSDTWKYVEDNNLGHISQVGDIEKYSKEFRIYTIHSGCQNLRNLGIFAQTGKNKRLPVNIHEYNKDSLAQLIAGLFDSDGYVYFPEGKPKEGHVAFTQSNIALLKEVKEQLLKFGIHSYIKKDKAKQVSYRDHVINSKTSYKLMIKDKESLIRMYRSIPMNVSYKKENLRLLAEFKSNLAAKNSTHLGVKPVRVKKITPIGKQFIYNLQADDSHTYIANTIITHNTIIGGIAGLGAGLAGFFTGRKKAKKKAKKLNRQIDTANDLALRNLQGRADSIAMDTNLDLQANYAAFGGGLNQLGSGGKIYIKPSKRGTFTREAKKRGLGVQEFASKVLANKDNYSTAMVKKANFARNFGGKKHAFGGDLDFPDALTEFNTGGTHEESSLGGIPQGVDQNGVPNLVEEGESKYDNYVFSDRITLDREMLKPAGLPSSLAGKTFSKAARFMAREPKERPNDPISIRSLKDSMTKLMALQEAIKEPEEDNTFAYGGMVDDPPFFSKYAMYNRVLPEDNIMVPYRRGQSPIDNPRGLEQPVEVPVSITPTRSRRTGRFIKERPVLMAEDTTMPSVRPISNPDVRVSSSGQYDLVPMGFQSTSTAASSESYPVSTTGTKGGSDWTRGLDSSLLRYAPVIGSAIGAFKNQQPNYDNADRIESSLQDAVFDPVGNYLRYNPLDRNYYLNMLQGQAGATRRAIVNQSGGNRATAMAGLLAADYNANNAVGQLARQAEEYNQAQRERVEGFNRQTNQFNSEGGLKSSSINAELGLKAAMAAAQMREAERNNVDAAKSANLTRFFDNLGEIGREKQARNMVNFNPANYYFIDSTGKIRYKGLDELDQQEQKVVKRMAKRKAKNKRSKGGFLNL